MTRIPPLVLFVCLLAAALPAAGQDSKSRVPRTKDGRPDLQGVWNFSSGVPLQRPPSFAGRRFFTKEEFDVRRAAIWNALAATAKFAPVENVGFDWIDKDLHVDDLRTSLITYPDDGRLPSLVEGVRRVPGPEDLIALLADAKGGLPPGLLDLVAAFGGSGRKDSHTDFNAFERCLDTPSVPFVPQIGENYVQIIQARDSVALVSDFDRRIVSLDGRPPARTLRSRTGTSRGRWEGDTLIVETSRFDDRTPSFSGAGHSRDKVVTERFTRTSGGVMQYSATIVDPMTFADRIELSFPMARLDARIFEGACHEGNYSLANTLSAVRKEEQEEAARKTH